MAFADWSLKPQWRRYAAELAGTAILVFFGVGAVALDFAASSPVPHLIPAAWLRRLLPGALFGSAGALVAVSPLGRSSGAHLNPAISFAFWLQAKLGGSDLAGYVAAQCAGALLGISALVSIFSLPLSQINDGATLPDPRLPIWVAFLGEVGATWVLVAAIFFMLGHRRTMVYTPLAVVLTVAVLVCLEAPLSGTSMNPARTFGPDLVRASFGWLWLYCIAPLLGAGLAVLSFRLPGVRSRAPLTAHLFHVEGVRSRFENLWDNRHETRLERFWRALEAYWLSSQSADGQ